MNKKIIIVAVIFLLGISYYLLSPLFIVKEIYEELPVENIQPILSAQLIPSAHEVSGKVAIYEIDLKKTLRFEDFDTVNGPDLFIYLATDITSSDFVNLGEIKATKGNINYEIPFGTDLDKYDTVLVWCKQFKVLFSYAELK